MIRIALRDARGAIIGWSVGVGVMMLLTLASFPSFRGNEELDQLWEDMPEGARELFGGAGNISTYEGFLDSQFLSLLPVLLGIFGIMHAGRVLAGEEERGRLDLLLSTPLTRARLAWSQGFAVLAAQAIVVGVVAVLTVLGTLAIGEDVAPWRVFLAVLDVLPAAWTIAMVVFLAGALAHRRGPASLVGTVYLVAAFFLGGLAPLSDATDPLKYLSVTYHYEQSDWLGGGPDVLYVLLFLLLPALLLWLSVLRFERKDLTG